MKARYTIAAALFALAYTVSASAEYKCPFDNAKDCALDAEVEQRLAQITDPKTGRPDIARLPGIQKPVARPQPQPQPQHRPYLDHYEPKQICQPSTVMTHEDVMSAWSGSSAGPQGWDCQTIMIPVYR